MSLEQTTPSQIAFTLSNGNAYPVYLVTPNVSLYGGVDIGKPFLSVGGCPVYFGQTVSTPSLDTVEATVGGTVVGGTVAAITVATPTVTAQYTPNGEKVIPLLVQANQWMQDTPTAQQLAADLLEDLIYPRPVLAGLTIVADPRLQIADRITIYDPDCSRMDSDCVLVGITTTISATSWDQQIDARCVSQPGFWVLGQPGFSEMGSTTWT